MCSYEELVRNYVVSVVWLCRGVLLSDNVSFGVGFGTRVSH